MEYKLTMAAMRCWSKYITIRGDKMKKIMMFALAALVSSVAAVALAHPGHGGGPGHGHGGGGGGWSGGQVGYRSAQNVYEGWGNCVRAVDFYSPFVRMGSRLEIHSSSAQAACRDISRDFSFATVMQQQKVNGSVAQHDGYGWTVNKNGRVIRVLRCELRRPDCR
jgi:hypothetical protein